MTSKTTTRTASGYFAILESPKLTLHPEWRRIAILAVLATGILLVALHVCGAL